MQFPFGFTLTVKRDGGRDPFGNPKPGTSHDITGCAAAPAGSVEYSNGQATVITQDTIYGPYDADVKAQDTVTVPDGQPLAAGKYQVTGEPERWKNPFTGLEAGCVIHLTGIQG